MTAVPPGGPSTNRRSMGPSRLSPEMSYQGQVPPGSTVSTSGASTTVTHAPRSYVSSRRRAVAAYSGRCSSDHRWPLPLRRRLAAMAMVLAPVPVSTTTWGRSCITVLASSRRMSGVATKPCVTGSGTAPAMMSRVSSRAASWSNRWRCCLRPTRSERAELARSERRSRASRRRPCAIWRRTRRPMMTRATVVAAAGPTTSAASLDTNLAEQHDHADQQARRDGHREVGHHGSLSGRHSAVHRAHTKQVRVRQSDRPPT